MMKSHDTWFDDEIFPTILGLCIMPESQTLIHFNNDDQNFVFRRWWERIGVKEFIEYYNKGDNVKSYLPIA